MSLFETRRDELEGKALKRVEGILDDENAPDGLVLHACKMVLERTSPAAKSVNVNLHTVSEYRYTPAAELADQVLNALPEGQL